ncbi:acetylornithine transaminase [Geobacter sulfurreducens]|uniref:Acetylornithine aminotransferase n=1 Tax=Geobacter sulfurreducens (strain ATCC 51573 / DSM 12127 / PCA) TaxID=243231 RepID=Q74GU3_GEOSL|nr:acetylornithine transaminase [Geobacter sulfurreducens]AAR33486.1 acetylornithine aminotransferase [Geobacter sulfurreducens PCA]UAC04252.1 acetylornithine transaminase [Geobacter sulfurreducens]UTG92870.1 acetylornithine transaminase [Geobacter sulfurreducens]HBB69277.1 acetylornithine transaminase [Geobacter sulfurreducens]HCD96998.1 acetylornithine transaminase [Geobacter sulfurreducens]
MNTTQWIAKADKYIMKTYGRYPLVPVRGEGCRVWDADGKEYLDFLAGVAVNNLGHCHPKVVEALRTQAAEIIHCSNYYHIPNQIELAELLCAHSFADKVFFCNSGAEANEAAIKLARKHAREKTGDAERYGIITALASFHGRTMATISATGQEKVQKFFDPLLHGFTYVPFDDAAALEAAVTPTTCAVMLEPIQGEGGVVVPSADYFRKVREICDRHGLLLIFDEVQVGIGRTGKLFAHEHFDVTPDIMTLAKALAGGAPIGAMLARDEIAASFSPGTHGSTFGGNPLVTAAGLAAVRAVLEEGLLNRAEEMGEYLVGELERLKGKYDIITDVRGIGLMVGMELSVPAGDIVLKGLERGVLLNVAQDRVLRFVPPLVVTKQEVNDMIAVLDGILEEMTK